MPLLTCVHADSIPWLKETNLESQLQEQGRSP